MAADGANPLQDALNNVKCLEEFALPDEQPSIEPQAASVVYEVSFDTNFADRTAFITGIGRYNEEATICSNLNWILEDGETYAGMLYTWRSLSRAVPAIKNNEQANRMEIYEKTLQVLGPEVEKAKKMMLFVNEAAARFTEEIKTLAHPEKRKDFISETYLLTIAKLINMFSTLDALKNMKACINNDMACYKRAESILRRGSLDAFSIEESQKLSLFFASNNSITMLLKKNLEEVPGFDEILVETINLCCHYYENHMYVMPKEKYILLKAIAYGMVLMDGNVVNINKLRKLNLQRIDKIFKLLPVAPLYGDVQINLPMLVKTLPHHDSSRWTCTSDYVEEKVSISIITKMDQIRAEHVAFISLLARYNNEIITSGNFTVNDQIAKELTDMARNGILLLSNWTTSVMEMYCWKLLHPTNEYDNKECPKDAEAYEKALRYNYSSDEKYAFVEVLGMIKGLSLLMHRMEGVFTKAIHRHIHHIVQEFIQLTIRDPLRGTIKKKKHQAKTILLGLRTVCVDWLNNEEPKDDPALRGEKDPKTGYRVELPHRKVGVSSTQLYMVRTMLESLTSEKAGKKSLRFDLKEGALQDFEIFHKNSFFFPHLLNFSTTLRECCDLSQLWFREFFLELTMGDRIQFPIEMSLPWILTDHILENKEAYMMEYILYPMDLYSDSGHYALHHFKKQFLYDEIEAEVNLCFDQMVYKLSEHIFAYFKQKAASIILDKRYRSELSSVNFPHPAPNRYETLLKQQHVQLLGRSINLNHLLCQRLGASMLKALDTCIQKFEGGDICSIVELDILIEINRLTHKMLSKYVSLDPFVSMLREVDQGVSAPHGRITLHVFWELHYDFLPNFSYNSTTERFVKSKYSFAETAEREPPPKGAGVTMLLYGTKALREAYNAILKLHENFVGPEHFAAITRLLGYQGIAMVLEQLLNIMDGTVKNNVVPYVQALMDGMPPKCKLPRYEYGTKGVFEFYYAQLAPVIQYRDLRTEVFQSFKEIGNTIVFCLLLEKALAQEEVMDLLQAAPFQGVYPRPFVKENQSAEMVLQEMERQYANIHLVALVEKHGTKQQISNAKDCNLLTKERLCRGLSMFEVVMRRIKGFLTDPILTGKVPLNGVMNIDECNEFHRLWSAVQFVYCMPLKKGELTPEECFGEGLQWAGCTILTLLGQQKRFEALDFCYHLSRVYEVDSQDGDVHGMSAKKLVERIRLFKNLNDQIFSILTKHLSSTDIIAPQIREFPPPMPQSITTTI